MRLLDTPLQHTILHDEKYTQIQSVGKVCFWSSLQRENVQAEPSKVKRRSDEGKPISDRSQHTVRRDGKRNRVLCDTADPRLEPQSQQKGESKI